MYTAGALLSFVLGSVVGSFLNVVIYRWNTGKGINGRSMCLSCGKPLRWYELVPIVSFLAQKGKCRECASKISPQYPLVEAGTAFTFLLVFLKEYAGHGPTAVTLGEAAAAALVWCSLIVIFVYDLRHKIIPDAFVAVFGALSVVRILWHHGAGFHDWNGFAAGLFAGVVMFVPFLLLWLVSKGGWIGFGDAKLALGIGWFLGLKPAVSAVLIGIWSGALFSVALMVLSKLGKGKGIVPRRITRKTEIPFAPFLVIGVFLVYFFDLSVIAF